ncbi:hypothetical protein T03_10553 [Trichinella britovi]|uniref:Uncharacterized protein n=1 Tax=Trichinella britovi TaxID=45882 RepID=A0A0V1CTQ9_TRIBR|nr:hypothetical protein T03_10553 [Trichinella britovi]
MYTEVVYEFCGKASPNALFEIHFNLLFIHLFESLILLEESEHSGIYNRLAMATIVLTTIIVNCPNRVCKTELVALENCKKHYWKSNSEEEL